MLCGKLATRWQYPPVLSPLDVPAASSCWDSGREESGILRRKFSHLRAPTQKGPSNCPCVTWNSTQEQDLALLGSVPKGASPPLTEKKILHSSALHLAPGLHLAGDLFPSIPCWPIHHLCPVPTPARWYRPWQKGQGLPAHQ